MHTILFEKGSKNILKLNIKAFGLSLGIVWGMWGFCDTGISGVIIAWLYNKFQK